MILYLLPVVAYPYRIKFNEDRQWSDNSCFHQVKWKINLFGLTFNHLYNIRLIIQYISL